jgi:hypothetical protein
MRNSGVPGARCAIALGMYGKKARTGQNNLSNNRNAHLTNINAAQMEI